ncbi:MAG: flagellar basal body L-ring protein FlgH [Bacteriovorax sp.]|nr:flagellar basal body L-ring protein FlgH [Bacteriovorax sp.]
MKIKSFIILGTLSVLLTSCSSYINSMYKDFEQQDRQNNEVDVPTDGFEQYRHPKRRTSTEYNRVDRTITTGNEKSVTPNIKRQYKAEKEAVKRYTASDLTDKGSDGSLWAGSDPNAFLFSNNKSKNSGDIIQINVLPRLKNEITMELKKAFPDNPYDTKTGAETAKSGDPKAPVADKPATDKKEATTADTAGGDSAQDKISGVVVEEINREHLLIKGRKNVLFKNRKRMVEVQALVSRKDIGENDTVSSDAILESNVTVVR